MKIVVDFPPNIGDIVATFPLSGNEIFTWGETIYSPSTEKLPIELIAHENVHCKQQGEEIQAWWDRYLIDPEFRFRQELEAHIVEYRVYCNNQPNRNMRRVYLREVSKRLASPMYGNMVTFEKAKRMIRKK